MEEKTTKQIDRKKTLEFARPIEEAEAAALNMAESERAGAFAPETGHEADGPAEPLAELVELVDAGRGNEEDRAWPAGISGPPNTLRLGSRSARKDRAPGLCSSRGRERRRRGSIPPPPCNMKHDPKKQRSVQLELFTMQPRPVKPALWPTPSGSCYRLQAAVVRESGFRVRVAPELDAPESA